MDYVLSGSVFITFDFVGLHRWLNAPREVAYLSHMHRHLFKVRVEVDVEHHDREIEFHMLKRDMVGKLMGSYAAVTGTSDLLLHESSCEQVALGIMDQLRLAYPDRLYYRVEVSEDGENGSIIEAQASPAVNSEEAAGNTVTSETGSSQGSPEPRGHSAQCLLIGGGPGHDACVCYCHHNASEAEASMSGRYA